MSRNNTEMAKKNIELEAECAKLRATAKETIEKYSTVSKRYNDKVEEIQRQFDLEKERLNEQAKKEAILQRAHHFDSINEIKRQLESIYNEKATQNKMEHTGLMQQLNEEREQLKKDTEQHMLQMANERHQVNDELEKMRIQIKQELDDFHARIKRDEQECAIRIVLEMDEEREKIKCQLIEVRKELSKQMDKEDEDKRKKAEDEVAEMIKQAEIACNEKKRKTEDEIVEMMKQNEVACNEKMSKLKIMMQQIEKDQTRLKQEEEKLHAWHHMVEEQLKKKEEEQNAKLQNELTQLKQKEEERMKHHNAQLQMLQKREEEHNAKFQHELTQLKQKEEEHNKRFYNDVKMIRDERNQMKQQLDEERDQIKQDEHERHVQFLTHMKDEREKMKSQLEKERQQNQSLLSNEREELEKNFNARVAKNCAAHDLTVQRLNDERNKEREQVKQHMDELMNDKKKLELEYSKTKELQLELKLEKDRIVEEAKKNKEALRISSEEALTKKKQENEHLFKLAMNKHQAAHDAAIRKLNDEIDKVKESDFVRENEHAQLIQKTKMELAEKIKSNTDAFAKAKLELEAKFNENMEKLNQERNQIKQNELDLNAKQQQLENDRTTLFKQAQIDAAEQRKLISKELDQAKLEQEKKFEIEYSKTKELQLELKLEKDRVVEEAKKNKEAFRISSEAAFAEKKQENEHLFKLAMNKHQAAHDAAVRKLNDEIDKVKENDSVRENEHAQLIQKINMELAEKIKSNTDAFAKAKLELETKFNSATAEYNQTVENIKRNAQQKIEMFQKDTEAHRKKCEEEFNARKKELQYKFDVENKERQLAHDESMKNLKNERAQMNLNLTMLTKSLTQDCDNYKEKIHNEFLAEKQSNEQLVKTALEECNIKSKYAELKIEKLKLLQEELMQERKMLNEEMTLIKSERNLIETKRAMLAEKQNELVELEKSHSVLTTSLLNKIEQLKNDYQLRYESLVKVNDELKQRLESDKPMLEHLHDAVATNFGHLQFIQSLDFNNKRVVIYSHYSELEELESYNWLTIESIEHYFDYVFILTNSPNEWNLHSLNHNKIFLLDYNMKSDFRNYGAFIMQISHKLANAACLALVNDSFIIVDVNAFGCCIKNLFETKLSSYDFIGLTSSYENQFHVQSYFLCFSSTILQCVLDYFKTTGLPKNHGAAISSYELGMSAHLISQGFSQFAYVSNDEMKKPFNTTCCKWDTVLNETGIIKRQHFLKKYVIMAMTDKDISEVSENYSYNVHFIDFLKYHNVRFTSTSVQ